VKRKDATATRGLSQGETVLIVSRCDRPFLPPVDKGFGGEVLDFEDLACDQVWKRSPRLVLLSPYKRATSHFDELSSAVAFTLGRWFRGGAHCVAIVPCRENDGQSFRDGDLRNAVVSMLGSAIPGFRTWFARPQVAPGKTRLVRECPGLVLQARDVGVYAAPSQVTFNLDSLGGVSAAKQPSMARPSDATLETIAENDLNQPVVVSYCEGKGRATVVFRGMLGGAFTWLNDWIPRILVLRFPNDYRVNAGLSELGEPAKSEKSETEDSETPNRFSGDSSRKSSVIINGRIHRVPWRGRLMLQLLYNATHQQRLTRSLKLGVKWPSVLADAKDRENIARGLREATRKLNAELLSRGTPTSPPGLPPAVVAGIDGLEHGWERWDGLGEKPDAEMESLSIDPRPARKPRG
jgi:hypothetical protein